MFGTRRDQEAPIDPPIRVTEIAAPLVNEKPGRASRAATGHQATAPNKPAPTLAQARTLRDVQHRYLALLRKRYAPTESGGPLTESERREESELRARYIDMAQRIECPPGYSYGNAREDSDRLHQLHCKRLSPRGELTSAEDDEEAILTARVAAYWQSPKGRERKRLEELELRRFSRRLLNDEEQKELDELRKKYPVVKTESEIGRKLRELQEQRSRDHGRMRHRPPD